MLLVKTRLSVPTCSMVTTAPAPLCLKEPIARKVKRILHACIHGVVLDIICVLSDYVDVTL